MSLDGLGSDEEALRDLSVGHSLSSHARDPQLAREPYAIEPPPDSPWRWAIDVDSPAGRARLIEPAPLEAAVTVHFGLADWVRVLAGKQDPLTAMVAGRCSVEGDVTLAARLEAMFGAR